PRAKRRRLARPQRKPEADLRFRVTVQAGPASGVAGVADEVRWVDADLVEGTLVLLIEVAVEQQVEVGWAVQPAVGLDLVLQLPRAPAGIPQRQHRPARPLAAGDGLQDVD